MPPDIALLLAGIAKFLQTNWQTSISALFGTFLGAYLAFLFQRRHSDAKEQEANLAATKAAQFAIAVQLRGAINIKQQMLDPKREEAERHLTLLPFTVHIKFPSLNIPSLTFMLKGEGAQLLNEMMLAEHHFNTLIGALMERNIRHEAMQRRVSEQGEVIGLDNATITILKDMTDSIYGLGEDAVKDLQSVFELLRTYIEKTFPGAKALSIELKK